VLSFPAGLAYWLHSREAEVSSLLPHVCQIVNPILFTALYAGVWVKLRRGASRRRKGRATASKQGHT
jgi:hypothetical protein